MGSILMIFNVENDDDPLDLQILVASSSLNVQTNWLGFWGTSRELQISTLLS